MRKLITGIGTLFLSFGILAFGESTVETKYSGPSGQGDVIYWYPSTGITNLVMTSNGVSVLNNSGTTGTSLTNHTWVGTTTVKGTANFTGSTNTFTGPTTISNATTKVYGRDFVAVAGGGYSDNTASTNVFVGKVALNGAEGAPGTVVAHSTNAPTSTAIAPIWIPIVHNGSNFWFAAWYQGS